MSGGVDSSVAAALLRRQGHEVVGVFMRHGEGSPLAAGEEMGLAPSGNHVVPGQSDRGEVPVPISSPAAAGDRADGKQGCCSAADAADARRVADRLDIPFYALDFREEFSRIIDYFVAEYTAGRTPNPCTVCNQWLKFGKLFDYADSVGARYVATGHYARRDTGDDSLPRLLRGRDAAKDQSYALFGVERSLLERILLPVGDFEKTQIRELAAELDLPVAEKRESQEICFVPAGRHDQFVRERRGDVDTAGEIVTTDGRVVGTHEGIERFTVGQRRGLRVALGQPQYVVRIEADTHRVVIGDHDELARAELTADRTNWLIDPPAGPIRCRAQIRYNSTAAAATAEALPQQRLRVQFDQPRHGVAPGQAVVLFDEADQQVLGGGWIE